MVKRSLGASLLLFGALAAAVAAQDRIERGPFANQMYVFAGAANFSLASASVPPGVEGTSSTLSLGAGATVGLSSGRVFFDLEVEYARASYPGSYPSDDLRWLDWKDSVTYLHFFLNAGIVPAAGVPLGLYATFGGAWQSNETYPLILGLGLRVAPVRFLALRGDVKFYLNEEQRWTDIGGGWYEEAGSTFSFGATRLTASMELRFGFPGR